MIVPIEKHKQKLEKYINYKVYVPRSDIMNKKVSLDHQKHYALKDLKYRKNYEYCYSETANLYWHIA